jgi:D-alanine-D-alanine ligase
MKSLKIVLLFDLSLPIPQEDYHLYWNTPDWKTEKDVKNALTKLGHTVVSYGLHNDIEPFLKLVKAEKPDLVFNMSEAFSGNRNFEPNMTALLQLIGVPFTGAGPKSLHLCKDKALTKIVLEYHDVLTPKFLVSKKAKPVQTLRDFPYPAFVKPLQLESSEGISQVSYVTNEKEALARVNYIHNRLGVDVIIEEFIDGRELYVGVLGNEKLQVFPPRELFFKHVPEDEPKFATFKIKWDANYRKKWGIDSGWAKELPELTEKKLAEDCKKIYRLLNIQGFARIDLRVKHTGEIYFIEANPNPSIAKNEDYALSASKVGIDYEELIGKIVNLSLSSAASEAAA